MSLEKKLDILLAIFIILLVASVIGSIGVWFLKIAGTLFGFVILALIVLFLIK